VTTLSVPGVVGIMMGAWFLASAYSSYVAAELAALATSSTTSGGDSEIAGALGGYTELFGQLLWTGLIAGALLLLITPWLKRLMHGVR
jgi:POT family proton-dependent oligopeptide transporter